MLLLSAHTLASRSPSSTRAPANIREADGRSAIGGEQFVVQAVNVN